MGNSYIRTAGAMFLIGAILVNVPYTLLIMNFSYPDILREPAGVVLEQYHAGGTQLLLTWLAFAWVGLPILFGVIMLQKIMEGEGTPYLIIGTIAGVIGGVAQITGLLRWVFVVPVLADIYVDPTASEAAKEAAIIGFKVVHQYGGVVMGEHIGQVFTIVWMVIVNLSMRRSPLFRSWVSWFGLLASVVYFLAQGELIQTVLPAFPTVPEAGLIGSLMWLAWMVIVGVFLLRANTNN